MTTAFDAQLPASPKQSCSNCKKKISGFLHTPRHQCRLCGEFFCSECTDQKALIPPSSIALVPNNSGGGGVKEPMSMDPNLPAAPPTRKIDGQEQQTKLQERQQQLNTRGKYLAIDAISENDGTEGDDLESLVTSDTFLSEEELAMSISDRFLLGSRFHKSQESLLLDDDMSVSIDASSTDLSYANTASVRRSLQQQQVQEQEVHLYGRGQEERMKIAREPLRVCLPCYFHLQHLQEELRNCNSNAVRYNSINPTGVRRLLNSPMAFTLGHEVRKAAYTLSNLLPMPKKLAAFQTFGGGIDGEFEQEKDTCKNGCFKVAGNFSNVDGVRIPARLLEQARGVAFLTVMKVGMGFTGIEFGTGLVVARLPDDTWSPPCAIGTAGVSWGALVGLQLSDHVLLLMTENAVDVLSSNEGSVRLGADVGVAVGPLGRTVEADVGSGGGVTLAPIYTYSLSKGLYMGASFDGKVIITRHGVNEKFYGQRVDARALLRGDVPTPPAAQPLYDALKRCHAYARCVV